MSWEEEEINALDLTQDDMRTQRWVEVNGGKSKWKNYGVEQLVGIIEVGMINSSNKHPVPRMILKTLTNLGNDFQ